MTPRTPAPQRSARGFTLLELLIAVALMAVLAVLCWRGLDSVIRSRDRIGEASDRLRAMTVAFSQMEDDLRRSWTVQLLGLPVAATIAFAVDTTGSGPSMEILREAGGIADPLQVQRVIYRVRDGVLERGFAAWVDPRMQGAGAGGSTSGLSAGDPAPMVWQPLVGSVASMDMRAWVGTRGWVSATTLATENPAGTRGTTSTTQSTTAAAPTSGAGQATGGTAATAGTQATTATPTPAAVANPNAISGVELQLVQRDGTRLLRAFPVKD